MFKWNFSSREKKIMIPLIIALLFTIAEAECGLLEDRGVDTLTTRLRHNRGVVAKWGDAEHRGRNFYTDHSDSNESFDARSVSTELSSSDSRVYIHHSFSADASSAKTSKERREKKGRTHRKCQTCPHDMMKNYKNMGIKWICGSYQRARRTFKSECMMRYRNCQDGTMFVKTADHRCRDNTYHGRHWFYIYYV